MLFVVLAERIALMQMAAKVHVVLKLYKTRHSHSVLF